MNKAEDRKLITRDELMFGRKGPFCGIISAMAMKMLAINKANNLYSENFHKEPFTSALLGDLGISYKISEADIKNIPTQGSVIFICNHPTGALDGIMLIDALAKIRPDIKFMGNYLLNRIEPMRKNIISVDPFDSKDAGTNRRGLREAMEHLRAGNALALFPAGEVATWQRGFGDVKDKPWEESALKFIRNARVPVVPLCIEARNSFMFRLAGKISPKLRTALLPRELFNKKGREINIVIGGELSPSKLSHLDEGQYGSYLRASVDYLFGCRTLTEKQKRLLFRRRQRKLQNLPEEEIVGRIPLEMLLEEIESIREDYLLYDMDSHSLYCAPASRIPLMLDEIGRMREVTFREVGEGTRKSIDRDRYDEYYHHLFLWDNTENQLVGAYRMGFGDEIVPRYGLRGFYSDSLFRYDDHMEPILRSSIEMGRSFIAKEYQRKPASLLLLWKGILKTLLKHEQFRYMIGPVSISGELHSSSKIIMTNFLRQHHFREDLAPHIKPVRGLKGLRADIDPALMETIDSIELINKIVMDIEEDNRSIPVLVKKYMSMESYVLGFNIDPDFCDAVDALILLDLNDIPEDSIMMLSKELKDVDVMGRFKKKL